MNGPPDAWESQRASWMIQAGFVRKWTFSFQMLSRGIKWIRQFRNTNFIRLAQDRLKASKLLHESGPFAKRKVRG